MAVLRRRVWDIAEAVIGLLEKRFAKLRDYIEVVDIVTPMTTLHFTGNGHGSRPPSRRWRWHCSPAGA